MVQKPNNIIKIPCSLSKDFFKLWFLFLKPFHKLTDREIDVITRFLKLRFELSKVITDNTILDNVTMSKENKKAIREECGLTLPHFQVIMSKLKKQKVIINERINPRFIPNIKENDSHFQLLLLFNNTDESQ